MIVSYVGELKSILRKLMKRIGKWQKKSIMRLWNIVKVKGVLYKIMIECFIY